MIQRIENVRARLHAYNLKATPQRLLVLEILEEVGGHLDAETICKLASRRDPNISLATVYRSLSALQKTGLVMQRYFARNHKREYFESVHKGEHYHFTCLSCGKTFEVTTDRIRQAEDELSARYGFTFTHLCLCLEGYCADCTADRQDDPANVDAKPTLALRLASSD